MRNGGEIRRVFERLLNARDEVSFSRRSRDFPIRKSMRGELNAATHNDRTLYDIVHFVWQFVRAKMPRHVERWETVAVQFATCHPVLTPRRIYTYSCVHVRAYTCPIPNKGAHMEGLAVAGYIGGCGVNNTSRSSYIGDSPAWLRRTSELEQETKLIKTDTIFNKKVFTFSRRVKMHVRCIRFIRIS